MSVCSKRLVIIPAYNEEESIGRVLCEIREYYPAMPILVVNDGSSDRTSLVARRYGAYVLDLPFNLGYGGALQTGYRFAVREGYDEVVQIDGDGQHGPKEIAVLFAKLEHGWDIVIGSRFQGDARFDPGFAKSVGIRLFRFLILILTRQRITDPTSGFQALSRHVFTYYAQTGNFPDDYPDADTLICMLKKGFTATEVPVAMYPRSSGKGMHGGLKAVFYTLKVLLSIAVVLLRSEIVQTGWERYGADL